MTRQVASRAQLAQRLALLDAEIADERALRIRDLLDGKETFAAGDELIQLADERAALAEAIAVLDASSCHGGPEAS